jgi:hypothetical protein
MLSGHARACRQRVVLVEDVVELLLLGMVASATSPMMAELRGQGGGTAAEALFSKCGLCNKLGPRL